MSFSRSTSSRCSSFLNYNELIGRDLQRGDLIEIDRGTYNHWAMYTGKCENGTHWCFHVTTSDDGDFEKKESFTSLSNGSKAVATIKKHKLKQILDDTDSKKPSMARINNKIREANEKNCKPRPIDSVIEELEKQKDEIIEYCVKALNCEHYVTIWKYGAGWSRQVEVAEAATVAAVAAISFAAVGGLIYGIFKIFNSSSQHEDDPDSD